MSTSVADRAMIAQLPRRPGSRPGGLLRVSEARPHLHQGGGGGQGRERDGAHREGEDEGSGSGTHASLLARVDAVHARAAVTSITPSPTSSERAIHSRASDWGGSTNVRGGVLSWVCTPPN